MPAEHCVVLTGLIWRVFNVYGPLVRSLFSQVICPQPPGSTRSCSRANATGKRVNQRR
ncbi:MAG: hypothetical protein U0350_34210 [Caldilineaceae bacterium]